MVAEFLFEINFIFLFACAGNAERKVLVIFVLADYYTQDQWLINWLVL
jgi:hypothetical protein